MNIGRVKINTKELPSIIYEVVARNAETENVSEDVAAALKRHLPGTGSLS